VARGLEDCSVHTLIPLERVVISIRLIINNRKKRKKENLTERSDVFKGFRDLAEGQLAEVAHDGCL
jgi:hypothetical protein